MILGLVRWMQPVHGYDVRRELLSWSADEWANVAPGSIYHALRKLAEEGLLEEVATEQVGARPARTTYRITPRASRVRGAAAPVLVGATTSRSTRSRRRSRSCRRCRATRRPRRCATGRGCCAAAVGIAARRIEQRLDAQVQADARGLDAGAVDRADGGGDPVVRADRRRGSRRGRAPDPSRRTMAALLRPLVGRASTGRNAQYCNVGYRSSHIANSSNLTASRHIALA